MQVLRTKMASPPAHYGVQTQACYYSRTIDWTRICKPDVKRLLRPGHTPLPKAYANQLDTAVDPKCPICGEEPQTVGHWLQRYPNVVALRQQLFGEPSPPLLVLITNPGC